MEKNIKSFDGVKINYYDSKKKNQKEQKTIVFLHGWLGNKTHWKKYFDFFSKKNYRIIALDLRGFGKSGKPKLKRDYSFRKSALDLNEILKREKISSIYLAGYSMGGMAALQFYKNFSSKIDKLVLMLTSYKMPIKNDNLKKHFDSLLSIIEKKRLRGKVKREVDFTKQNYYLSSIEIALNESTPLSLLAYIDRMYKFDFTSNLSKIKIPVLIVSAKKDVFMPEKYGRFMKKQIKNSKYLYFDADHTFLLRDSLEGPKKMLEFLENLEFN